ncbi:hypothetical protein BDN67DRAFT_982443 [Paxillus ammoniavirescens]|nr:hypothetical protein BDN67DRAFT_982443 [Paxillus ammoniavirescens]
MSPNNSHEAQYGYQPQPPSGYPTNSRQCSGHSSSLSGHNLIPPTSHRPTPPPNAQLPTPTRENPHGAMTSRGRLAETESSSSPSSRLQRPGISSSPGAPNLLSPSHGPPHAPNAQFRGPPRENPQHRGVMSKGGLSGKGGGSSSSSQLQCQGSSFSLGAPNLSSSSHRTPQKAREDPAPNHDATPPRGIRQQGNSSSLGAPNLLSPSSHRPSLPPNAQLPTPARQNPQHHNVVSSRGGLARTESSSTSSSRPGPVPTSGTSIQPQSPISVPHTNWPGGTNETYPSSSRETALPRRDYDSHNPPSAPEPSQRTTHNLPSSSQLPLARIQSYLAYAIFSHCWGDSELEFPQMSNQSHGMNPPPTGQGYEKLLRLYTCCINKDSSTELEGAIRAMYQWYKDASVCIVHLARSSSIKDFPNEPWFKRGWTLQELLAPRKMRFYGRDWIPICLESRDRDVNDKQNESILVAISKQSIREDEWAPKRNTTNLEDRAYSLIGIFDISMNIACNEGLDKAFHRLMKAIARGCTEPWFFAWCGEPSPYSRALPSSPACYRRLDLTMVDPIDSLPHGDSSYDITKLGLRVKLLLVQTTKQDIRRSIDSKTHRCTLKPAGGILSSIPSFPYLEGEAFARIALSNDLEGTTRNCW